MVIKQLWLLSVFQGIGRAERTHLAYFGPALRYALGVYWNWPRLLPQSLRRAPVFWILVIACGRCVSAQLDGGKRGMAEPAVDACDCSLEVMSAALRTFVRATAPFAYNFVFYFAAASPRSQ